MGPGRSHCRRLAGVAVLESGEGGRHPGPGQAGQLDQGVEVGGAGVGDRSHIVGDSASPAGEEPP